MSAVLLCRLKITHWWECAHSSCSSFICFPGRVQVIISESGSVFHLSGSHGCRQKKPGDCLGALSVFSPPCPGSRSGEAELAALAAHCALVRGPSLQSRSGLKTESEERLKSGLNKGMLEFSLAENFRNGHFLLVLS